MNCRTYEVHNLFRLQTSVNPLQQGSRDKSSRTHPPPQRHRRRSDSTRRFHAAARSAQRLEPRQPHASNRFLPSCLDRRAVFDDMQRLARSLRIQESLHAPAAEEIVEKRYNLELLSGISVLVSIASVVLMMALMLPGMAHRVPASNASSAIAVGALPPAVNAR